MSKLYKPRLRSFEKASNQRHITDKDRFLYKKQDHESKYRINIIGDGYVHFGGFAHLRYDTDMLSQPGDVQAGDVLPIDQNLTIMEKINQFQPTPQYLSLIDVQNKSFIDDPLL